MSHIQQGIIQVGTTITQKVMITSQHLGFILLVFHSQESCVLILTMKWLLLFSAVRGIRDEITI